MLILSCRLEETITISPDIEITVKRIGRDYVRIGFEAPRSHKIVRKVISGQGPASLEDEPKTAD